MVTFIRNAVFPLSIGSWGYYLTSTLIQTAGGSELTSLEQLFSLGVGGVVAALVLWWKRQDDKEHKEEMAKQHELHRADLLAHKEEMKVLLEKSDKREERLANAFDAFSSTLKDLTAVVDRVASRADLSEKTDLPAGNAGLYGFLPETFCCRWDPAQLRSPVSENGFPGEERRREKMAVGFDRTGRQPLAAGAPAAPTRSIAGAGGSGGPPRRSADRFG